MPLAGAACCTVADVAANSGAGWLGAAVEKDGKPVGRGVTITSPLVPLDANCVLASPLSHTPAIDMTYVEHANKVLDYLESQRRSDLRILPLDNTALLKATTDTNPANYAVAYGQVSSLLDIAAMEADLPLIGRLIIFNHQDNQSGPWANWLQFDSLLFHSAPRAKEWSDADMSAIRVNLKAGMPSEIWKSMEKDSAQWLDRALKCAQQVIRKYIDQSLAVEADARSR